MDFLNRLGKKASETYQFTKEKTSKISEELKLKNKISENKSKIEDLYKQIGECTYNEVKNGEKCESLTEKCDEISALKEEIVRIEQEILSIKNIKKCVSCGVEMERGAEFCSKCGAKQPVEEKVEAKEADEIKEPENTEPKE